MSAKTPIVTHANAVQYFTSLCKLQSDLVLRFPQLASLPSTIDEIALLGHAGILPIAVDPLFTACFPVDIENSKDPFPQCFDTKEGANHLPYIDCIIRKEFAGLTQQISQHAAERFQLKHVAANEDIPKALLIRGPMGMGKSYALLYDVSARRLNPDNRVVYIPTCASWTTNDNPKISTAFFLQALLLAFARELPAVPVDLPLAGPLSAQQQQQQLFNLVESAVLRLMGSDESLTDRAVDSLLGSTLAACITHCQQQGKQLYFYFDQHNSLDSAMLKISPYNLAGQASINMFSKSGGVLIACISANNQPIDRRVCFRVASEWHFIAQYSSEEIFTLLVQTFPSLNMGIPIHSQAMRNAVVLTNRIPLEVAEFFRLVKKYHAEYSSPAAAALPSDLDILIAVNERFKIERVNHMMEVEIRFALTALTLRDSDEDCLNFDTLIKAVISSGQYFQDTRRRMLQLYIFETLKESILRKKLPLDLTLRGLQADGYVQTGIFARRFIINLNFKEMQLVEFYDNGLPHLYAFDTRETTLLIPKSPNYPSFDFFVWSVEQQALIGFSVAINLPKHEFKWPPLLGASVVATKDASGADMNRQQQWESHLNAAIFHYEGRVGNAQLHHAWVAHKKQAAPDASRNSSHIWILTTRKLLETNRFPVLTNLKINDD